MYQEEAQQLLYDFYNDIIETIRLHDKDTSIILDSSAYADPQTFRLLKPHKDANLLYSFHMYEPYEYTNHKMNKGTLRYPGMIGNQHWDRETLAAYISSVITFQKTHAIPSSRIIVGEFGGHPMSPGLEQYFEDLLSIFTTEGWHYAFYAFREDTWDGMDYELGSEKLPWSHWQAIERGEKPHLRRKETSPAISVLKNRTIGLNRTYFLAAFSMQKPSYWI